MSAFKRRGRTTYDAKVFDRNADEWLTRSCKTRDPVTAKRMQAMHDAFLTKREWELIDPLVDKSVSVPAMYDMYLEEGRDLERLKARLKDVDLEPLVAEWIKNPGGKVKPGTDTAAHYEYHVRGLIKKGEKFPLHRFTTAVIQQHLEELEVGPPANRKEEVKSSEWKPASPATRRKAGAAFSSFGKWLFRRGVLKSKPMRDVELPPPSDPRLFFLDTPDAKRLADAQPGQYRNLSALLAGSGAEVSAALALTPRRVDLKNKEIRPGGTKTYNRDRVVRVADWAWPYVEEVVKGKHPDALLFDQIPDRWRAAAVHNDAVEALVAQGHKVFAAYTMRDARHTFAVRKIRAGVPPEVVARELGHANSVLVAKVYGRFQPRQEERDKWEKVATAADTERHREDAK